MDRGQQFFLDSSKIDELKQWKSVIRGITTNQLIMMKDGVTDVDGQIRRISKLVPEYPVSVELTNSLAPVKEMTKEAERLHVLGKNVVIKVPISRGKMSEPLDPKSTSTEMLELIDKLVALNIPVNVTCMMTDMQMILAAAVLLNKVRKNCFVSLFWARSIEDHEKYRSNPGFIRNHKEESGEDSVMGAESYINQNSALIVKAVRQFISEDPWPKIIVGSIRSVAQVEEAFAAGAHIVTVTPKVLRAGLFSRRSLETIAEFDLAGEKLKK